MRPIESVSGLKELTSWPTAFKGWFTFELNWKRKDKIFVQSD